MFDFKRANATAATTAIRSSTAYKIVPERSTSAIASSLDRLFGTSGGALSRENSLSSIPGQQQGWEVNTTEQRRKARELDSIRREFDEYLEEPLETFSKIEKVDDIEQTVVFDILTFWQVWAIPSHTHHQL